jgi:hypothetical protein
MAEQAGWRLDGRVRQLLWVPRGPLGLALFVVLIAVLAALAVVVSALLLTAAIVGGLALAAYQGGKVLLAGNDRRRTVHLPEIDGRFLHRRERPLETYLSLVEEMDHLTTQALALQPPNPGAWRSGRKTVRLLDRAVALREHAIAIEREVATQHGAETAQPRLWELVVASTELVRFYQAMAEYPSGRHHAGQMRELADLRARREQIDRRRDDLIRHLQETDLRDQPLPVHN